METGQEAQTVFAPSSPTLHACVKGSRESYISHARRSPSTPSMANKSQQRLYSPNSGQRTTTPKSSSRRRKAEEERLVRVADLWDQVRAERQQERHEVLSQKVVLQRALISAQDRRSQLLKRQEEQAKTKKRIEERTKRQGTLAALQDTCRQSLDLDRQGKNKTTTLVADGFRNQMGPGQAGEKSSSNSASASHRRTHVPASSCMDGPEYDIVEMARPKRRLGTSSAPGHHAGVHKLLGHRAGRHTSTSERKAAHSMLADLSGHLNASQIWASLWSGSVDKLLQVDQKFPQDLKETFGSHVRQGLSKFQKPVSRSFTNTEDVPDLSRLMDQTKLHQIRVLRHKTQLMFRSSQTNQDRTRILLYNNPFPSTSYWDDGVIRFLPPVTEDTESVSSEASYLRWLKPTWSQVEADRDKKGHEENVSSLQEGSRQSLLPLSSENSRCQQNQSQQNLWNSVTAGHKHRKVPKYHFLTEEEAITTGAFLARLNLDNSTGEKRSDLQGRTLMSGPPVKVKDRNSLKQPSEVSSWRSAGTSHQTPTSHSESPWQPLSLNALREYKTELKSKGLGDFQQGRPSMWQATAPSAV